jgi:hypothetical protein
MLDFLSELYIWDYVIFCFYNCVVLFVHVLSLFFFFKKKKKEGCMDAFQGLA